MLKYFVILLSFLLFITKSYVFYLNKYYDQMVKECSVIKKDLDLLKVEWMYLNQPKRIQALAKKISSNNGDGSGNSNNLKNK